ncbi:MAG TPA: DNA methyltransferase [Candidatus Acidoferrum sp.]|jgi:site-specific DNA-methyltransferase (cytosine-N4-specific)
MASGIALARSRRDSHLISELEATDWDFANSTNESDAHNIHPFPAKFIAEIPRKILSFFRVPPGTAVLDPFAGSGTALLEAQRLGLDYVGVDLNPISVLISRVKTGGPILGGVDAAKCVSAAARQRLRSGQFTIPEIPRLEHWFQPDIAAVMSCITSDIEKLETTSKIKNFLRLSLSAITVRVSNQESETRYAALKKQLGPSDVFGLFEKSAASIAAKLQRSDTLFSHRMGAGKVVQSDAREIGSVELPPVSLVITSPPYPNAFEYWLYNKYRMYWLGFDPIDVREREFGARPHYASSKGDTIEDFLEQMVLTFAGISRHLVDGAHAVIVVASECRIRGKVHDLPTRLEGELQRVSYAPLTRIKRRIPRTRKAFNPDIGSIESETLLFLRWRGK